MSYIKNKIKRVTIGFFSTVFYRKYSHKEYFLLTNSSKKRLRAVLEKIRKDLSVQEIYIMDNLF